MNTERDEYQERARLAFENQEEARGYARNYRVAATTALVVAALGVLVMWLVWLIPGPEFNHNSPPPPPPTVIVRPVR